MTRARDRCLILEIVGDITIVRLRRREAVDAECDLHDYTDEVGQALYNLVDERGLSRILLDLALFDTLSHPGEFGRLIYLGKKVKLAGGKLKLLCQPSAYREVFRITRLDRVFEFYEDEREALDSVW